MSKDGKYFKCAKTPNGEATADEEKKELLEFGRKVQTMRNGVCDCAAAGDSVAASNVAEVFQQLGDAAVRQPLLADMSHPQWDTVPACKMHTNQPSPEHADTDSTPNIPDAAQSPQQPAQMTANRKNSNSSSNDANTNTNINNTTESPAATINSNNTNGPPLPPLRQAQPPHQPPRKGSAASNAAAAHSPVQTTRSTGSNGEDETDVIGDLVGHFGKWQCLMTMLLSLFQVPNTFHISSSVYQAANKNFWCMRPPHLQHLPVDVWRNLSDSNDNCFQAHADWSQVPNDTVKLQQQQHQQQQQQLYQQHQQLQEHQLQQQSQPQSLFSGPFAAASNASRVSCAAWEYDSNDNLGNTWTSEWDLVCDKEYLKNVAEMFFLLGVATGGLLSGYLSDKFGRKKMLFISAVLQTIFGLALYFANSFEMYLTLRALLGLMSVSVTYAGLILAIEYVDGKWRTIAGMYNLFPLPISYMLISGIAYLTQDYQRLQLCIGIPGIFLCFLWFVVPESPRWLLVKGRIAEVKIIVQAAADFNGRQLPPNFESMLQPPPQEANSQDCMRLFRSSYLRRISICFLCIWFTMNLVYYGLILNMSSFGGNVYLNSALAGLVEIPAIAIAMYIITKVGKKWLFSATLICTAIACCCAAITEGQDDLLWLKITFLMIGKFTISAGNTIMPVYTAELYPTAIRNVGVGACNVAAGLALILTPYLSLLTKIESHLLMSLLTAWTLFGGFVVLFLPESTKAKTKIDPPEEKC